MTNPSSNAASELLRAANFAAQRHAQQKRKGAQGEPYINHLLEVAGILADATDGSDTHLLIAALLHDTVEGVGVAGEEIERWFGADVAELVLEVTDDKSLPKARRKALQVEHAPHKSARAKMLKIADKVSNLRALVSSPPPDWSLERKVEYFEWARQVAEGCSGQNEKLDALFEASHHHGLEMLKSA